MNITIDDLNGNTVDVDMRYVGAVYEDDDVIYFGGTPFRLSSARPAIRLTPVAAEAASVTASEGDDTNRRPAEHDG